ncbi:MAG TPA: hypothetical protein VG963_06775 [Polyangiaceae bacterium]|nr:hypothetical protein [Polyangiaceae bacterium]
MVVSAKQVEKSVQEHERFTRLESRVEHLQSIVGEIKADLRTLTEKLEGVKDAISQIQASRGLDKVWWMSIAAGLLGVMARGFKWL